MNGKVLLLLVKMKLSRNMAFRFSFFGVSFVDGTMFLVQLLLFSAIYSQVDTIGGWNRRQMLFFIGTFSLIDALNMATYFFGIVNIPEKIKTGQMDLYITKPIHPLLHLSFESFDPGSLPLVAASTGLLAYAASGMPQPADPGRVAGYILLVLLMLLLYYDLMVILRTIPFFTIQANSIHRLEGELITLCMKIPGTLFKGAFKVLFYLILPYGIIATVPVQFFTGALSPAGLVHAILVAAGFTAFTLWFWRLGLRNYKSTGS